MRDTGCEAVVLHREYPVTKQIKLKNLNEKIVKIIILEKISYIAEKKLIIKTSPFFL